ncbi:helix-turn-helix domain-containing protein [Pedococcus dokdonensis]
MPARVLAYMLVDDGDCYTAAGLAEGVGVSPASISGAVRDLTAKRLLVEERVPGSRAKLYRVSESDLGSMILATWIPVLMQWESALSAATIEVCGRGGGGHRLAEATSFVAFLRGETEEMPDRWSDYRREPQ